jgi:hypothetical protein
MRVLRYVDRELLRPEQPMALPLRGRIIGLTPDIAAGTPQSRRNA